VVTTPLGLDRRKRSHNWQKCAILSMVNRAFTSPPVWWK
jgi:hypothetical protein